jgi:hypothetical protein
MDLFKHCEKEGFVGSFSEVIEVEIKKGEQLHQFPNVKTELQKTNIIGMLVMFGDGNEKSVISSKTLATKAQMSSAFLSLTNENRVAFKMPISLFNVENKPLLYVPVLIKSFNATESNITFPKIVDFDAVVQIIFITGK